MKIYNIEPLIKINPSHPQFRTLHNPHSLTTPTNWLTYNEYFGKCLNPNKSIPNGPQNKATRTNMTNNHSTHINHHQHIGQNPQPPGPQQTYCNHHLDPSTENKHNWPHIARKQPPQITQRPQQSIPIHVTQEYKQTATIRRHQFPQP